MRVNRPEAEQKGASRSTARSKRGPQNLNYRGMLKHETLQNLAKDLVIALGESEATVFFASVPPVREVVDLLNELLDDAERERASRFAFERDADLFITAHALLRYILWRTTAIASWQFSVNPFGKPELSRPFGDPPLRFNLSHSKSLAVCAVCYDHDIGVDVEAADDDFQIDEVAAHAFTESERAQLVVDPPASRLAAFLRMWTLKEALMKGCGYGFSLSPTSFEISLEPLSFSNSQDRSMTPEHWHVEQRALSAHHWACVAIRRPPGATMSVRWQSVDTVEIVRALGGRPRDKEAGRA